MCLLVWFLEINPLSQRAQSPETWTLYLAPGDESLATQSTVVWILPSMNLHVELYVVPGDETLATQSPLLLILLRKTLYVYLQMFPGDESLATQGTVSWILQSLNL